MDDDEKKWLDAEVSLIGIVEEYLTLDGRSWVKIRVKDGNNGKCLMINTRHVRILNEKKDDPINK